MMIGSTQPFKASRGQARARNGLRALLLVGCSLGGLTVPAWAAPEGGQVVAGSARIAGEGTPSLRVDQNSRKAVIDWRSFSIGVDESATFHVPDASSITLNRVRGESASQILGRLESNGRLFLVNPNGILFGKSARVDVAGIVATTADITNESFMSDGPLRFGTAGNGEASVVNEGLITVRDAGVAAFVAPRVRNSGVIQARLGKIALGAGERFTLDLAGDDLVRFEVGDEVARSFTDAEGKSTGALVESNGLLNAQGGSVLLTASAARQVINQSVRVTAPQASAVEIQNGVVKLKSGEAASVVAQNMKVKADGLVDIAADGAIDLSGANGGSLDINAHSLYLDGTIDLTGANMGGSLTARASDWMSVGGYVDASGVNGGGSMSLLSGAEMSFAGTLVANSTKGRGGSITMHAEERALATSGGTVDASGVHGGSIVHSAGQGLLSSAAYRAAGAFGRGGTIDLTADTVSLLSAELYAFGGVQGGRVRVGGEFQGGKNLAVDELANASTLVVNDGVVVDVSAKSTRGNGGEAIFWSDEQTTFLGSIDIRGGSSAGQGGFAEVSSGDSLVWDGKVESAWNGQRGGELLLDPKNITVATVLGDPSLKLTIDAASSYFTGQTVGNIGRSMSIDGTRLALGISSHSTDTPQVTGTGAVFLITFTDANFSGATLEGVIGRGYTGGKNVNMPNLVSLEGFGASVSLYGTQLAVGASRGSGLNDQQPGAYLFSFTDLAFSGGLQRLRFGRDLTGPNTVDTAAFGHLDDAFGASVALGDGVLAIGAPRDVGTSGQTTQPYGAVHLFTFSGNDFSSLTRVGTLGAGYTGGSSIDTQAATVGSNGNGSLFGTSIALDGRILAVGAPSKDGTANDAASSGAVFLYQFSNDSFGGGTQILKVERGATGANTHNATNVETGDEFGTSVALRNGILAVGAPRDDGSGVAGVFDTGNNYGAVHLFTLNSTSTGVDSTKVLGSGYANDVSGLAIGARFGYSVTLGDGTLGVGAQGGVTASGLNSGRAYLFNSGSGGSIANPLSYGDDPSASVTISPTSIANLLSAGTSVTLQANNDINVNAAITADNSSGNGGALTLQAGRSINVNAGITTDNGAVSLIANDLAANGVQSAYRDAGAAGITFGSSGFINAGTGTVSLEVRGGDGRESGEIDVGSITGGSVSILNNGTTAGSGVTIQSGKQITASGTGSAIVIAGDSFTNNAGSSALNLTGGGRFLIYSQNWASDTRGGLAGSNLYNRSYANAGPGTITQTGSQFIYEQQPTLTITASNASRAYGDANPTFGYTVSGLVNGDTQAGALSGAPSLTSSATATAAAGSTAAITASTGTLTSSQGYAFAFANGTLSITKALLTVTADNKSRAYGDANPTLTSTITGFKNGETASVLTATPTAATTATATSNAGTYAITVSGASATNYDFSYVPGTLTVTKAMLTVTANNASRTYGDANPTFSGSITGFKNSDTASVVSGLTYGTPATTASNVGTYAITGSGATATNYDFNYVPGTLTVTKATLSVTANNASREYGSTDPTFASTITGFKNGDTSAVISGLTITSNATATSDVGSYTLTASGASATNYDFSYAPGTLTVTKAMLTVTADNKSRAYGDANPTLTSTITGFKNGETASVLTAAPTATTAATTASNAGTYAITASGGAATNYDFNYVPGTLTVTKATLTVTANNASREYGLANPTFTGSVTGFKNGDTAAVVSSLTYGTAATTASNAGTYAITGSGATAANYDFNYVPGTLTVTKAMLTVTADDKSRTYGDANPTFTASFSGFRNGDTSAAISGLTLASVATAGSNVGTYAITGSGATAANYDFNYVPGTLTVGKATLTVTANNAGRAYGDANPTFGSTITGFKNSDTAAVVSGLTYGTPATTASAVGTYAINVSGGSAANYDFNYVPGTLTVGKATLTVTANNASRTYGDANPTFGSTITGFKNGDTDAVVSGLTLASSATATSGVGTYAINASGASATNYDFSYVPGTLTVTKAMLTVTAADASREYGLANPTFTGSVTGFKNGDTAAVVSGLGYASAAGTNSNVGTYAITGSGATAANYDFNYVPGTLTVTKATLTVTADDKSRTYGGANPVFTSSFSGLRAGDTGAVVSGLTYATPATAASGVGTYTVTPGSGTAQNYQLVYQPGTLTITKAMLTVTADNKSKTYNQANPTLTYSIDGLKNGDTESAFATPVSIATAATTGSSVGSYAITVSGATAANYDFSYVPGTLTVAKALVTIRADDKSKTYGQSNPTLTATVSGLPAGQETVLAGLSLTTTADASSSVGRYTITASGASSTDYDFEYVPGTLTITPALLTVTVGNATRTYGDANPALQASITGFVNGDQPSVVSGLTLATSATAASGVGTYAINGSGATASNYQFAYVPGVLTITKALLTVRAADASREYGLANPNFDGTISGFKNGDTAASVSGLTYRTTATAFSGVGTYAIVAGGATAANYDFNYLPGTLTVTKATLTVKADDKQRIYGQPNPPLTASILGLRAGDAASVVSGLTLATTADSSSLAGRYAINASGATAANYNFNYQPGTLTVVGAPIPDYALRPINTLPPAATNGPAGRVLASLPQVSGGLIAPIVNTGGSSDTRLNVLVSTPAAYVARPPLLQLQ